MHVLLLGDLWERQIIGLWPRGQRDDAAIVARVPFDPAELRRWLELFEETVDECFAGRRVNEAAEAIANERRRR